MPDDENSYILDRKQPAADAAKHLAQSLAVLRDLTNYGTHLIPRCLNSSSKSVTDMIALGGLLKHVVAMLDACEVLISQAAIYAAAVNVRSLFEASVALEWILKDDTDRRAQHFYVANLRRARFLATRAMSGTREREQFDDMMTGINVEPTHSTEEIDDKAAAEIAQIDRLLATEPLASINQSFDRKRGARPFDPRWYAPLGKRNLRELAEDLGRLPDYVLTYAWGSEIAHATDLNEMVTAARGEVRLTPIRHLGLASDVLNHVMRDGLRTMRVVLAFYRPEELDKQKLRYLKEWRDGFMKIPRLTYQGTGEVLRI